MREALEELLTEAEEEGATAFSEEGRELVRNALGFGELRVDDVMVPRADIKGVAIESGLRDVVAAMQAAQHSRLVVYRDHLDDVLGVVHLKDLLPFWGDGDDLLARADDAAGPGGAARRCGCSTCCWRCAGPASASPWWSTSSAAPTAW